jgi:hypothetical protein
MAGRGERDGRRGAKGNNQSMLVQPPRRSNHPHEPSFPSHTPQSLPVALRQIRRVDSRWLFAPALICATFLGPARVDARVLLPSNHRGEGPEIHRPLLHRSVVCRCTDAGMMARSTCVSLEVFLLVETRVSNFAARLSRTPRPPTFTELHGGQPHNEKVIPADELGRRDADLANTPQVHQVIYTSRGVSTSGTEVSPSKDRNRPSHHATCTSTTRMMAIYTTSNSAGILQHINNGPQRYPADLGHVKIANHVIQYIRSSLDGVCSRVQRYSMSHGTKMTKGDTDEPILTSLEVEHE